MTTEHATFDSWAEDSKQILNEIEEHLMGLRHLLMKEGIRDSTEARRLVALTTRHSRLATLMTEQIEATQAYAQKRKALRCLGRAPAQPRRRRRKL